MLVEWASDAAARICFHDRILFAGLIAANQKIARQWYSHHVLIVSFPTRVVTSGHSSRPVDNWILPIGWLPLFTAFAIDQYPQIRDGVGEMLGPLSVEGRMLAYQVVEHGL